MQKGRYIRLLSDKYYSPNTRKFIRTSILCFRVLEPSKKFEKTVSLVSADCAEKTDGSICKYIHNRREKKFSRVVSKPYIFWRIPDDALPKLSTSLYSHCLEKDSDCHVSLRILPAHEQNEEMFKKYNESLNNFVAENFKEEDVYICNCDHKEIKFSSDVYGQFVPPQETFYPYTQEALEQKLQDTLEKYEIKK